MFTFRRLMRPLLLCLTLPCGWGVARAVPVTIRVTDEAKKPLVGAAVRYFEAPAAKTDATETEDDQDEAADGESAGEKRVPKTAMTGADGTITLDLPDVKWDEATRKRMALVAARAKASGKEGTPMTPVLGAAQVSAPGLARVNLALRAGENALTMTPAAQMSGVVRDAKGAPLPGAKVELSRVSDEETRDDGFYSMGSSGFEPLGTTTGADGRWVLEELPRAGIAYLSASAPGYVDANFRAWLEGAENPAPPQKLASGGAVRGRLLNAKGEPIVGAQVYAGQNYGGAKVTDKEGKFALKGVPIGTQQLQIWSRKSNWFRGDEPLNARVTAGGDADMGDLISGEGTLINGIVIDKTTRKPMVGLELRLENQKLVTDAAGRFEGRVGSSYLQLEITGEYVSSGNNFRELPAKTATYDAGQIVVERAASLTLDVRDENGEAVFDTAVIFSGDNRQSYANFDGETQKVGPLVAGDYKITGYGAWEVIEPKTANVPAFVEGAKPKTLSVKMRKAPLQKVSGRVTDAKGEPLGNVTIAVKPGGSEFRYQNLSALSRRDGSWQTEFSPSREGERNGKVEPEVGKIEREGYALLRGGELTREGENWRAADLILARADATLNGRIVGADGAPIVNASLAWTGAKEGEFARTDAAGNFELTGLPDAPLQLRVSDGPRLLETRELTPGEIADIELPTRARSLDLDAQWRELSAGGIGELDAYFEALGAPRLLEAARRADAKIKPEGADEIGVNLDAYLRMSVRQDGARALQEDIALVRDKSLEGADGVGAAELALSAARSKDEAARAWASRWFDARKDEFSLQQEGNEGVVAALRLAAVGARLGRDDAASYRDLALVWSDRVKDDNRAYYVDNWGELLWAGGPEFFEMGIAEWPALDRLSALGGAVKRVETAEQGRALLQRLEKLADDPEVVKAEAERAEKQPYSESMRDRALRNGRANFARALLQTDPVAALDELEKITEGYAIQNIAIQVASAAIADDKPEIARRALRLGLKDNYSNKPGTSAMAMLARGFDSALADELLNDVRSSVLPDEENRFGNEDYLSVANYAVALREVEPGAGRLLLEGEWARRDVQKPDANERWQRDNARRELARAMAVYDVTRALEWAEKAGGEDNDGSNLRTSIIAAALATPAARPFMLVRENGG